MGERVPDGVNFFGRNTFIFSICGGTTFTTTLGSIDPRHRDEIRISFDGNPPYSVRTALFGRQSEGLTTYADDKGIIKRMKSHNTMRVEIYLYDNRRYLFDVPLAGFSAEYAKLGC